MLILKESMKKLVSLLVPVLLLTLAGCTPAKDATGGEPPTKQRIVYNLGSEPETLDPGSAAGTPGLTVINAAMEGLTRYDLDGQLQPAVAEQWDISDDGLEYRFYIRENARWSNGDPVTAHDFEYAWKRVLTPEFGARNAYELYYLKNAAAYNNPEDQSVTDAESVGVKALSDKVLLVTLESPAPQFITLTAFPTLFPVHRRTVEADANWHAQAETYVNNGPFSIESWEHEQKITFKKNAHYWDKESVRLEELVFTLVASESTELAMFESGQIDVGDNPPLTELDRLKGDTKSGLKIAGELSVYFYKLNTAAEPFDDLRVRQALALAIDRRAIVDNVAKAGQIPAYAVVPFGLVDVGPGEDFREVGGNKYFKEDAEKARELLEEAGYPGGEGFPELQLITSSADNNLEIAQAIQEMWKQQLGITSVSIIPVDWGAYFDKLMTGDFNVAFAGWNADYPDPIGFLDLFVGGSGNNNTGWSNDDYDRLIEQAAAGADAEERMAAMHQAEEILMQELPIIPIFFYTNPYLVKDYVKDVRVPSFGSQMEFKWAYLDR